MDTVKTHGVGVLVIRSRWVGREFKDPKEKDREDSFSATPPLEMMRLIMSRQATHRKDGRERKSMYFDMKKAHVIPLCEQDVYVELPGEAEVEDDWFYGCRPAGPGLGGALVSVAQEPCIQAVKVRTSSVRPRNQGYEWSCAWRRFLVGRH